MLFLELKDMEMLRTHLCLQAFLHFQMADCLEGHTVFNLLYFPWFIYLQDINYALSLENVVISLSIAPTDYFKQCDQLKGHT